MKWCQCHICRDFDSMRWCWKYLPVRYSVRQQSLRGLLQWLDSIQVQRR